MLEYAWKDDALFLVESSHCHRHACPSCSAIATLSVNRDEASLSNGHAVLARRGHRVHKFAQHFATPWTVGHAKKWTLKSDKERGREQAAGCRLAWTLKFEHAETDRIDMIHLVSHANTRVKIGHGNEGMLKI